MIYRNRGDEELSYECLRCGKRFNPEDVSLYKRIVICPYCGYKCIKKVRPDTVTTVKAI